MMKLRRYKKTIGTIFIGLGVLGSVGLILTSYYQNVDRWLIMVWWWGLIGFFLFGVYLYRRGKAIRFGGRKKSWNFGAILIVSVFAFGVRSIFLNIAPANLGGDEMTQAWEARKFLIGESTNMFGINDWYQTPNFYYFLVSWLMLWFDHGVWVWRMGSVVIGTLTVGFTYLLFDVLFGKRIGLMSGLLLAGYHMHLHFSRVGSHQASDGLWLVVVFWLLFSGLKQRNIVLMGLAGIWLGISQHFYFGARLLPILVILVMMTETILRRIQGTKHWLVTSWLVVGIGFFIGMSPFVSSYIRNPGAYFTRLNQVAIVDVKASLGNRSVQRQHWSTESLGSNAVQTMNAFIGGKKGGWYQPEQGIVNLVALPFLLIGFGWSLYKWRERGYWFLLITFILPMVVVGLFLDDVPQTQRMVLVLPLITALVAVGIDQSYQLLVRVVPEKDKYRWLVWLMAAWIIALDLWMYFIVYTPSRADGWNNAVTMTELAHYLEGVVPNSQVVFFGAPRIYVYGYSSMRFLPVEGVDVDELGATDDVVDEDRAVYIALPERVGELEELEQKNDEGVIRGVYYLQARGFEESWRYYFGGRYRAIRELTIESASRWRDWEPLFYVYDPKRLVS